MNSLSTEHEVAERLRKMTDLEAADHLFCDDFTVGTVVSKFSNIKAANTGFKRKIIQISSTFNKAVSYTVLFALCNDGTVWQKTGNSMDFEKSPWNLVSEIPQDGDIN